MQSRLTVHDLAVPVVERLGGQQLLPKSASKRTPAGRAAAAALSASKLAVEPALPHHAARGRREKSLPPCRASEQARPTREGKRSSCLSRSISRSRVHVFGGTTARSLRSTPPSAAASPPPPPPPPPSPPSPAAVAAVVGLAPARQAGCCCAALSHRPHKTTNWASWARWQIPSLSIVSSTPGRHTAPRESPAASELGLRALEQGVTTQVLLRSD